jgi:hypothetical protein
LKNSARCRTWSNSDRERPLSPSVRGWLLLDDDELLVPLDDGRVLAAAAVAAVLMVALGSRDWSDCCITVALARLSVTTCTVSSAGTATESRYSTSCLTSWNR